MAYDIESTTIGTLLAAADYSAKQYHLASIGSGGTALLASAAGQRCDGVIYNKPISGAATELRCGNVAKVRYGGTVTVGDKLVSDANAKAVTQTLNSQFVVGVALASGVADDVGEMIIGKEGDKAPTILTIPVSLAGVTTAQDVMTTYTPGFAGRIAKISWRCNVVSTTGSKLATFSLKIGSTAVTGGAVALTSALNTPMGKVTDGSAITAANTFGATDTISVVAASVTAFVEGSGELLIVLN